MTLSATQPRAGEAGSEPWRRWAAWDLVPGPVRGDLAVLFRFNGAVRAVADHPSASQERKEAALAALAAPFTSNASAAPAAPARALADLLSARGIDSRPAWQVLQAAGQDLRKTRYRDWSDLLTWCRFAAAPVGQLAAALAKVPAGRAVPLALALQLIDIVERAATHHRWLGRVYLPERWFHEASADVGELDFARISAPLAAVRARALDQAGALIDEARAKTEPLTWHQRAVMAALTAEMRKAIAHSRRAREHATAVYDPAPFTHRMIRLRARLAAALGH